MLILAFESSGKAASVALLKDGAIADEIFQQSGVTHSETLLPMAAEMLERNGIKVADLDLIACAYGPGSFTGIRIGVATVKGLSWAAEKKCIGISTAEAMAYLFKDKTCTVCTVQDARRSQVYNALFDIRDGTVTRLCPDRALAIEELADELKKSGIKPVLTGDGSYITAEAFDNLGVEYTLAPEELVYPRASGVALAADGREGYSSQELLPVYLRLSQAERERQAKLNLK